jgi:uncharacterized repeat protein (TIGR01451 family)
MSADPAPDIQTGNLLEWYFDSLDMQEAKQIVVRLQNPNNLYWGDSIRTVCWISPVLADSNLANNRDTLTQIVNDDGLDFWMKQVDPVGEMPVGYVLHGQRLTYTIPFQNQWIDIIENVVITDSIDQDMQVESITFEGSSHPMTTEIFGTGVIKFSLEHIYLPDDWTDILGSVGFVRYSIGPKPGLPDLTEVKNTAHVLLDGNNHYAYYTNEVLNTYITTTVGDLEISVEGDEVRLSPNPCKGSTQLLIPGGIQGGELIIYDLSGRKIKCVDDLNGTEISLQFDDMDAGTYLFCLCDQNEINYWGKIVIVP